MQSVIRGIAFLIEMPVIGALRRPLPVLVFAVAGGGYALWSHTWYPAFIGFGIAYMVAAWRGISWLVNGDH